MFLDEWFLENKRSFPWREDPTPYRVWISEVMLQQTRASVVVAYFERWMSLFPTIVSLGTAHIDQVIKAWEGLGYYSRARNLHAAAQMIIRDHGGELPSSKTELAALPGLGPYTVGAILSFGFQQRAVAIDGNVARVLARYAWIEEEISKSSAKRKIELAAEELLSQKQPWVSMEALIELGATICTSTPDCGQCPLQSKCVANARGMTTVLPIKAVGPKIEKISRGVAIVESEGYVLVRKNAVDGLMGDLWEFPYYDRIISPLGIRKKLTCFLGEQPIFLQRLEKLEHSFTKFIAQLFPYKFRLNERKPVEGFCWVLTSELERLPFSAGHRKLVKQLYTV